MACNPCCCLKLKDATVTIGIWSTIYALAQIALFGWQFSVLAQCQHVTMAQANLQCEYYCPCVGASTARTSAIIEGLFVIQILCLIAAFFLLFASIMMIYGVHTWSRFLLVPWMVTMCASILTSLAYCIMWWAGDVRDYWLMLTIVEMFGVFLNIYCFVVVVAFHRRMFAELEHYARRRKYERFSGQQQQQRREPPPLPPQQQHFPMSAGTLAQQQFLSATQTTFPRPAETFPPAATTLAPSAPHFPTDRRAPPQQQTQQQFYRQRTPMERFVEGAGEIPTVQPELDNGFSPPESPRSRSALERNFPRRSEDGDHCRENNTRHPRFRRTHSAHRYRAQCRNCGREHGSRRPTNVSRIHCPHCCHCHEEPNFIRPRHRNHSYSSLCSMIPERRGEEDNKDLRQIARGEESTLRRRGFRPPAPPPPQTHWSSDHESDNSWRGGFASAQPEHNYLNINPSERHRASEHELAPTVPRRRGRRKLGEDDSPPQKTQIATKPQFMTTPRGISIPQQIIIPPMEGDSTDPQAERKYKINSEITISYDHPSRKIDSSTSLPHNSNQQQQKQQIPLPAPQRFERNGAQQKLDDHHRLALEAFPSSPTPRMPPSILKISSPPSQSVRFGGVECDRQQRTEAPMPAERRSLKTTTTPTPKNQLPMAFTSSV